MKDHADKSFLEPPPPREVTWLEVILAGLAGLIFGLLLGFHVPH